ncbi:ubiquinol-cytochrome-c reductase complex subunit-domain-containing protein [Cantharellus anzutake]|uniref:ubiquinol-cytochrome-c reductase complex subunit-domain-containing protein n=1 Tax=Cantharellus anzutake TaxID=1750568 RepID=UPI001903D001|nr:ubiquinol-cytochrome-c reductase complex subunit-domain-containing protein [Cantharellus anzutake]KAF8329740.1 ubiquinol-cytochrome-c reductase complex subunit-domain-containing protein [Cantharellus anzutake]
MARFSLIPRAGPLPGAIRHWVPSLGIWGFGAAFAVSYFMSDVPKFRMDVLDNIPIVRSYFIDDTPASDKPF